MSRSVLRPLSTVSALVAGLLVAIVVRGPAAGAFPGPGTVPLSAGNLTMISTHADKTSGMPEAGVEGANQVAINDDGTFVAFVSDVPAQDLVTDPVQLARGVTDNNTNVGTTNKGDDVFVYQKFPGPQNPIISLVSENLTGTGTGNAPSDRPVMAPTPGPAPLGPGLVFQSSATDMVSGSVAASQNHIYAWVTGLSSLTGVFLIDTKYNSSDACDCAATNPSISLVGPLGPTVVFEATGGGSNDLVGPGVLGQTETQVYAHSIVGGANTLVSVTNNTTVPNARSSQDPDVGNGALGGAGEPMIASDAPIVVFSANGDDLIKDFDSSNGSNIWEHNLLTNVTTLVSKSVGNDPGGTSGNHTPVISNFGTSVAWSSNSNDISNTPFPPAQQNNPFDHLYAQLVLPIQSPTVMVDTDSLGAIACDSNSNDIGISGDGLSVAFQSNCDDISATPDTNGHGTDVFERTFAPIPGLPKLLSINDTGDGTGNADSSMCAPDDGNFNAPCADHTNPGVGINFDGTVVAYFTSASNIARPAIGVPPFNDGSVIVSYPQILGGVKNVLASFRSTDGGFAEGTSGDPVVSKDGSSVAFASSADNLVADDTNDYFDVFESDLHNSFFATSTAVDEGAGTATISVARTGNNGTSDSVDVATADGFDTSIAPNPFPTATEAFQPGDYKETTDTLHFPPGVDVQTFDVPIVDDSDVEGPELFHITLSPSSAGGSGLPGPAGDAYVEILDNDVPPQDWSAAVTSVPASAHVGDTVTVKTTITVQSGADDLTVNSLGSGPSTSGLDEVSFADATPFTVSAGTTKEVTATARVTAAPGSAGVQLQTSIDGSLGAAGSTKTALSSAITVNEAVSATLTGAPAHVGLPGQITYTLHLTNDSDTTAAQLDVPQAGFAVPTGTSLVGRTDGAVALAPGASTDYVLTVSVDDTDADGTVLTESPTGLTYAMSDITLPSRPVAVTPAASTVDAPVVVVEPHTIIDHDGGTLLDDDVVDVSVTVANTGGADTAATLVDTLTNLKAPTGIKLDGAACGACSSDATSVTAPINPLAAGGSHVLTFSAAVKSSVADGQAVKSIAVVTFTPHTTGTSPTAANEQSLTVGSDNLQGWTLTISGEPPGSVSVGDTVPAKATIAVTSGADHLSVTDLSSGAGTSGLDEVNFSDNAPFEVAAGTAKEVTVAARVVAAPGTGGVLLEVSATGALGAAAPDTKTADTDAIQVGEAVSATLSGGPATVTTADQITYTLSVTNSSDTAAQLAGLPAALVAPAGTTAVAPASGSTTVAAHDSTDWTLTVDVDDADSAGTVLTQVPGTVSYAMSAIGLAARPVAVTPSSVTSTVTVPDTTDPDVTINEKAGQADPTSTPPVHFDVEFSENVTGFDEADVDLSSSTVGGTLISSVTGSGSSYDVSVTGMTTSGNVVAAIPSGAAMDAASNPSTASTSTDNSIAWIEAVASHVAVTTTPNSPVYGQTVHAHATVTVDSGTPAGSVQFSVDGANVGSAVNLGPGGVANSPALTGPAASALTAGAHQVTGTFTPSDPNTYGGSSKLANFVVSQAATHTSVSVHPHSIRAVVTPVAPGAGSPTGTVTFSIDGFQVGSAPVIGGTAVFGKAVPAGKTRHVGAAYSGDANFTASSDSTARRDPSITAHRSSAHARTKYGWYRSPVTITFDCATHGASLVSGCPAPVTLKHSGAAQVVTRTVKAIDGGLATVNVHVNLDRRDPHVQISGVTDGGQYPAPGPTPKCVASDGLSGVASCVLQLSHHGSSTSSNFRVTATDKAGNTATVTGSFQLLPITLVGAGFEHGAYTVQRKHTYLLVVHSATRPTYLDAAPFPQQPFRPDPFQMRSAGHHRWSLPITMTQKLRAHRYWNIGVQIGSTVHVLKIRVLAP